MKYYFVSYFTSWGPLIVLNRLNNLTRLKIKALLLKGNNNNNNNYYYYSLPFQMLVYINPRTSSGIFVIFYSFTVLTKIH